MVNQNINIGEIIVNQYERFMDKKRKILWGQTDKPERGEILGEKVKIT